MSKKNRSEAVSKKNKKTKYIAGFAALCLLAAATAYRIDTVLAKKNDLTLPSTVQTVLVQDAALVPKDNYLDLYGSIGALNKTSVSAKVAGRVSEVLVKDGDAVAGGQALVRLEDQDYRNLLSTSRNTLTKAQLKLGDVQADYERYQKLLAAGAMSQQDVDKAKLAVEAAQADVNSAQIGVDNAQESLNNATVTAPFAGVVAARSVAVGQMVSAGLPLLSLEDVSSVYAIVNVKQEDLDKVKVGLPAQVIVDGDTQHPLTGVLSEISPVANPAARVFETKIKLNNRAGILKPGMFVKTRITTGVPTKVLAVSLAALSGQEGDYTLFVAEGNKARQRAVTIGSVFGDEIEITSGLKAGEKVIVTNVNKLKDGDPITVGGKQGVK